MTVTLREIITANWQECVNLTLAPGQEHFVSSNAYSLAESKFQPTFVPLAIYAGEAMVGFVMYGYYPDGGPPLGQRFWIYRLMIDQGHQRKGYGRAAMREVIARLRATPDCPDVLIGYEPDNDAAARLYRELGFEEIGPAPWGETLACLKLQAESRAGD